MSVAPPKGKCFLILQQQNLLFVLTEGCLPTLLRAAWERVVLLSSQTQPARVCVGGSGDKKLFVYPSPPQLCMHSGNTPGGYARAMQATEKIPIQTTFQISRHRNKQHYSPSKDVLLVDPKKPRDCSCNIFCRKTTSEKKTSATQTYHKRNSKEFNEWSSAKRVFSKGWGHLWDIS